MSRAGLSCPYCNSTVVPAPGTQPGQRLTCHRCGESFPYRGQAVEFTSLPPQVTTPVDPPQRPTKPRRPSNALVLLALLGVMTLMALVTWYFVQNTVDIRRAHDESLPKSRAVAIPVSLRVLLGGYVVGLVAIILWGWSQRERLAERTLLQKLAMPVLTAVVLTLFAATLVLLEGRPARPTTSVEPPSTVKRIPPSQLPALGYLLPGTNTVLALHVAEAQETAAGRNALKQLRLGEVGAESLEKWCGIKLDDMDHVALGVIIDDQFPPRMALAVHTRQPYDAELVRTTLKAGRTTERGGKTLHRFDLGQFGLDALLWCVNDRTLIVSRHLEDFDRIPAEPRSNPDHLAEPLRAYLTERMGPSAQVWIAGHVDGWDKGGMQLLLMGLLKQNAPMVSSLRTFGAWAVCDEGLTLNGSVRCVDEPAATKLKEWLNSPGTPENKGTEKGEGKEDTGLRRELRQSLRTIQNGLWVEFQAKASVRE